MQQKMIALLVAVILSVLTPQTFAGAPSIKLNDFAFGGDLTTAESEFRRFSLSASMVKNIQRRDLGDIRVFDNNNDLMPVLVRKKGGKVKTSQQTLAFSRHRGSATSSGYILDRSAKHKQSLKSLQLRWKPGRSPKVLTVRVEHSADKKTWQTLKNAEMVYNVEFKGKALKQNSIDINNYTQRYIKLSFLNKRRAPALVSAKAVTTSKKLPDHLWVPPSPLKVDKSITNAYRFSVSKGISPHLLKLSFAELNNILSGRLYAIEVAEGELKKKTLVNNFDAYAVSLNNKVVRPKPIDVSKWQSSEWMITSKALSAYSEEDLPGVMAAYPSYEVIFADDGKAPYTAVWGSNAAGAPMSGDLVERIKAGKLSLKDIAVVKPEFVLNNDRLTELMESRQTPWLTLLLGLFAVGIVAFSYKRYLVR